MKEFPPRKLFCISEKWFFHERYKIINTNERFFFLLFEGWKSFWLELFSILPKWSCVWSYFSIENNWTTRRYEKFSLLFRSLLPRSYRMLKIDVNKRIKLIWEPSGLHGIRHERQDRNLSKFQNSMCFWIRGKHKISSRLEILLKKLDMNIKYHFVKISWITLWSYPVPVLDIRRLQNYSLI